MYVDLTAEEFPWREKRKHTRFKFSLGCFGLTQRLVASLPPDHAMFIDLTVTTGSTFDVTMAERVESSSFFFQKDYHESKIPQCTVYVAVIPREGAKANEWRPEGKDKGKIAEEWGVVQIAVTAAVVLPQPKLMCVRVICFFVESSSNHGPHPKNRRYPPHLNSKTHLARLRKDALPWNPKAPFDFVALLKKSLSAAATTPQEAGEEGPRAGLQPDASEDLPSMPPIPPSSSTPDHQGILPLPPPSNPRKRQQKFACKRAKKRKLNKEASRQAGGSNDALSQVLSHGAAVEVDLDASELDTAQGAHTGKPGRQENLGSQAEKEKVYTLEELLAQGFEHIEWDGRTPIPIVDRSGRIITVLASQPGPGYACDLLEAFRLFSEAGKEAGLGATATGGPHKRGKFPAFNRVPTPVAINPGFMGAILNRLVGAHAVRRMAAYQNAAFSLWAPRVYEEYKNARNTLRDKLPHLPENFPGLSQFGAAAFNLGGKVWTFKHRDFLNWPFG
ncbi:hypothetical protein EV359DRAFT_69100, partial [Lentinula novae-zelandiae]